KWLCSEPDIATKTCDNIDRLDVAPDGRLINTGEKLIAPTQEITMTVTSTAHFENGALCGSVEQADLEKAIVRVKGQALPADRNAIVLQKLVSMFKPMFGLKVCEGLRLNEGNLVKFGQMQGSAMPLGQNVHWISPEEGYRRFQHRHAIGARVQAFQHG
ncbi:hypothetical protein KXV85_004773, partial [Aspergillus fumigatus]